jgi:prephenate dehydrogenase
VPQSSDISARKTVCVIGGHGQLGRRMVELFAGLGHRTLVADLDTELTACAGAARADVTLVAVPIEQTVQVIREVGPHVPSSALLTDVTSIKSSPMEAMLASTRASVVGAHPMFGPGVADFAGHRLVLCRGRGDEWARWLRDAFERCGLIVTEASAEDHDRAMAVVQVLTHFQTQVYALTLSRLGVSVSESLRYSTPPYLLQLTVAARHFGLDPTLFGSIAMNNPLTAEVTAMFREAAAEVQHVLLTRDHATFSALFRAVHAFFSPAISKRTIDHASRLMNELSLQAAPVEPHTAR